MSGSSRRLPVGIEAAISRLFSSPDTARAVFGVGRGSFGSQRPNLGPDLPIEHRLAMLELELFGQLQLLADIAVEFEGSERERTEAEGMALLIALRELWRHVPELRHGEGLPHIIDGSAD